MWKMLGLPGQGLLQIEELALAFVLCALIGIEREIRQKSAGLRTHTLVGVSAALFMLVSKYGFMDILSRGVIVLDPSRVAAQVVSGIGFIGGGVIFMRRDVVRGLTTAASIWFSAALGMACGAGLVVLSLCTVLGYFLIMLAFPALARLVPRSGTLANEIHISYENGRGLLPVILMRCTELGFAIDRVRLDHDRGPIQASEETQDNADQEHVALPNAPAKTVNLTMLVKGKSPVSHLVARLGSIPGVREAGRAGENLELE